MSQKIVERPLYLNKLMPYLNKPVIKVITGVRRCGKSAIMALAAEYLKENGTDDEHIVRINFDSFDTEPLKDAAALHSYIMDKVRDGGMYYLFLDEVQEVHSWEKAVRSLFEKGCFDIILTGSNSNLLSSELATYIAGRYVEIPIQTLTFSEYLLFRKDLFGVVSPDISAEFNRYLALGGFPAIHAGGYEAEDALPLISDILSSVFLKDIVQRYQIRNTDLFYRILQFIFSNVGNLFSAKSIADYLKSQKVRLDVNTIYTYLAYMENAFLIRKVSRYNIVGKAVLQSQEKYYASDVSLIYALFGFRDSMVSGVLENVVYLELLSRGYHVYVGKIEAKEVDFAAEKNGRRMYVQVTYRWFGDESTEQREFAPLLDIRDQYPKYLVSMDSFFSGDRDGVHCMSVTDFLLDETW
ncbi:MAG TPA: ATP-binding protein [Methanocorpusculum sp.]|nr:ATP-binding protein [Methanocorpusculum sp.]